MSNLRFMNIASRVAVILYVFSSVSAFAEWDCTTIISNGSPYGYLCNCSDASGAVVGASVLTSYESELWTSGDVSSCGDFPLCAISVPGPIVSNSSNNKFEANFMNQLLRKVNAPVKLGPKFKVKVESKE